MGSSAHLHAYATGASRLYRVWVADGKAIPAEEMAELAVGLICSGASSLAEVVGQ